MSQRNFRDKTRYTGSSKCLSGVCVEKPPLGEDCSALNLRQLRALWDAGERECVKNYVKRHYFSSAMQEWLMRTKDVELIMAYLKSHPSSLLFDGAEDLLMEIRSYKLRKAYIEHGRLRQSSILLLFAEKQYALLRRYVVKHPEETFSRTILSLMFETGDKKLICQYVQLHPSLLKDERYAGKLEKNGLTNQVLTEY